MEKEDTPEIVFGTPDAPTKDIPRIEKKIQEKPKKKRPRCGERDSITLGYIWVCLRPKYHKGRHKYTRVPRDHGLPHPEKETHGLLN